jgi:hypothetical protein
MLWWHAFVIFGIIKFLAVLSMYVCAEALFWFLVLHNTPH